MAAPAVIERLPPETRKRVLDMLIAGEPSFKVAAIAKVSRQAIDRYRKRVVRPAVRVALNPHNHTPLETDSEQYIGAQAMNAQQTAQGSTVRNRVDFVWDKLAGNLQAAKSTDDVCKLADRLHASIDRLGILTGELVPQTNGPAATNQFLIHCERMSFQPSISGESPKLIEPGE
jgi:hypothetical protein